jgi:Flp pilus assembly pilin Flp
MPSTVAAVLRRMTGLRLRREEEGQDLLEYGLLTCLIAVIAIGAVTTLGNTVNQVFWTAIANSF